MYIFRYVKRWRREGTFLPYDKDAVRHADLRRGERDALWLAIKRYLHVGENTRELRGTEEFLWHWLCDLPQDWRAILHNLFHYRAL